MSLTLTSADRKAMSRRLVKIDNEILAFTTSQTNSGIDSAVYAETDDMNKTLMSFYNAIAASYETEKRALNGQVATSFIEQDVIDSANEIYGNLFFPRVDGGTPNNPHLIPGVADSTVPPDGVTEGFVNAVNGGASSVDAAYEQNTVNNPPVGGANSGDGIIQLINVLKNGNTPGAVASTTLSSTYTAGSGTMGVTSGSNIANGDYIIAQGNASGVSGLFLVKSGGGTGSLVVYEIAPPSGDIVVPVGPNTTAVTNSFVGFTNVERQNLVATVDADLQNVLDGLTTTGPNNLISKVLVWEGKINSENTALSGNQEERTAQIAQNVTAVTNNNATKVIIDAWQALANTGAGGKFTDAGIAGISSEATARASVISTRIAQILDALGSVTDNGDGTFTFSADDDIYPQRYTMLNVRINRGLGTLKKVLSLNKANTLLQQILDILNDSKNEYDNRLLVTRLASNGDDTQRITVEDSSGFSLADTVFVISENLSELTGTIKFINGNVIDLSFKVSSGYLKSDLARFYKEL